MFPHTSREINEINDVESTAVHERMNCCILEAVPLVMEDSHTVIICQPEMAAGVVEEARRQEPD